MTLPPHVCLLPFLFYTMLLHSVLCKECHYTILCSFCWLTHTNWPPPFYTTKVTGWQLDSFMALWRYHWPKCPPLKAVATIKFTSGYTTYSDLPFAKMEIGQRTFLWRASKNSWLHKGLEIQPIFYSSWSLLSTHIQTGASCYDVHIASGLYKPCVCILHKCPKGKKIAFTAFTRGIYGASLPLSHCVACSVTGTYHIWLKCESGPALVLLLKGLLFLFY